MPENRPDITLNEDGICNLCIAHDMAKKFETIKPLESDLIKILSKYQGKHRYDCMVMCSGGKDSTSALYYMKKRYKLNVLAFTFDHGFETDEALENIHNAVEILGVDFLFFKSAFMKDMFSKIISSNSKAVICHPCSIWYMDLAFDVAARYEIPIIVAGWTKGQSNKQEIMSKCGVMFIPPSLKLWPKTPGIFLTANSKTCLNTKSFPVAWKKSCPRQKNGLIQLLFLRIGFCPSAPKNMLKS